MEEGNFVALANNIQNELETNKTCHKLIHLKRRAFPEMKVEMKINSTPGVLSCK